MTGASKLTLSSEELQLVNDTHWILTKRNIIEKAAVMLGEHAAFSREYISAAALPAAVLHNSPKIARGENYLQLPWLMLDYPRLFDKENIFAIRTMFWWGNFFSVTLHLSGSYKKQYAPALLLNIPLQQQLFVCTGEDEWQHHFEKDNYTSAGMLTEAAIDTMLNEKDFIKVACRIPLQQWNQMPGLLQQAFTTLLKLLDV